MGVDSGLSNPAMSNHNSNHVDIISNYISPAFVVNSASYEYREAKSMCRTHLDNMLLQIFPSKVCETHGMYYIRLISVATNYVSVQLIHVGYVPSLCGNEADAAHQ